MHIIYTGFIIATNKYMYIWSLLDNMYNRVLRNMPKKGSKSAKKGHFGLIPLEGRYPKRPKNVFLPLFWVFFDFEIT